MLKIGITGKIGSGKSTICRIFESIDIPVYYSDTEAKKFYNYPEIIKTLCDKFGKGILDIDKKIDKRALASIVFNDEDKLEQLNCIIHPLVIKDFDAWYKEKNDFPYVLFESAIIYQCRIASLFSKIIYVDCPEEIAIKRVMKRDNTTHQAVLERLSKQKTETHPYDYIIFSNEQELEIPQVLKIHNQLLSLSNQT
ncbi:MAG: dephospho-CoA kinase [Bacteroidales bacterium]|jgi:dephospho-CoA kinase|nr:dephospho-CoA kinase [Bacteroidales bacterium]MDD4208930.1 dephospho-CoA kinase [Bacteroidales bacterium]